MCPLLRHRLHTGFTKPVLHYMGHLVANDISRHMYIIYNYIYICIYIYMSQKCIMHIINGEICTNGRRRRTEQNKTEQNRTQITQFTSLLTVST